MNTTIIFVPDFLLKLNRSCFLSGSIYITNYMVSFFIYDINYDCDGANTVGYLSVDDELNSTCTFELINIGQIYNKNNWLHVNLKNNSFTINNCILDAEKLLDYSLIYYNKQKFLESELFEIKEESLDPFGILIINLKFNYRKKHHSHKQISKYWSTSLSTCLRFVQILCKKSIVLLKFSSTGLHIKNYCETTLNVIENYKDETKLSLKSMNYALSVMTDFICGLLLFFFFFSYVNRNELFKILNTTLKNADDGLIKLIDWIMGTPAGFKLNHPLNQILGGFCMYNVNSWKLFIDYFAPLLKFVFYYFIHLALLGLSFQLAILSDIITVSTIHVYCIYVCVARLYYFQLNGILSLSTLFLGRKRNPEPDKVDSYPYTTEQLFVGTISFAVLLFFHPTTFIYYFVFTVIRFLIVGFNILQTKIASLILSLPIYSTILWLFHSNRVSINLNIYEQIYLIVAFLKFINQIDIICSLFKLTYMTKLTFYLSPNLTDLNQLSSWKLDLVRAPLIKTISATIFHCSSYYSDGVSWIGLITNLIIGKLV